MKKSLGNWSIVDIAQNTWVRSTFHKTSNCSGIIKEIKIQSLLFNEFQSNQHYTISKASRLALHITKETIPISNTKESVG